MELKINGLQHIGIPVANLKNSERFYEGLGFENVMTSQFEINGEKGFVSMMQRDKMIIEIYQMPPAELEEIKLRKNGHIDHIAFDVDDIDLTFQILTTYGYLVIETAPVFLNFWNKGCKYFNILGPDGERLEFNQIL
jgi:catechol 2,3-dioxygenase-like lactoylglutathione lyase family enzyme